MIFEDKVVLKAPIQDVWSFLLNPDIVLSCLPGAEKIDRISETIYDCVIRQKVGPISIRFKIRNILTDVSHLKHMIFEGEGDDVAKLGHIEHRSVINFSEASGGGVEIFIKAEVRIVGKIAMYGDRIIRAQASKVQSEFFEALQEKLRNLA